MAILAEYMVKRAEGEKLEDYLKNKSIRKQCRKQN